MLSMTSRGSTLWKAIVAAVAVLAADAAGAPTPQSPDQIQVPGTVRDFKRDHVDFNVTPFGGNGHYANNIALAASPDARPIFSGLGFRVATQWRDKNNNKIAPHLYYNSGTLTLWNAPQQSMNTTIDSWDSTAGPYGGGNVGPAPPMLIGGTMPSITPPTGLPQTYGPNVTIANSATATYSSSFKCNSFTAEANATINIAGDVTIQVQNQFLLNKQNQILLNPGAKLTLYVGSLSINQGSQINMNTFDPTKCKIYVLGSNNVSISQNCSVCAQIVAPNATMKLDQSDNFYGTFVGKGLILDQSSGFHWDGIPVTVCTELLADQLGSKGVDSAGGITSAGTFEQWYRDSLGDNLSAVHTITLTKNDSGIYEYLDNAFFPIDGMLFGNEGDDHNYFFTFTFSVDFTHHSCASPAKFFEFEGADDAWLFVDGKLAMDVGGVLPGTGQYVPIDRLGLVDGETYSLQLFYAQRNPTTAVFNVRTNLDLIVDPALVAGAGFD